MPPFRLTFRRPCSPELFSSDTFFTANTRESHVCTLFYVQIGLMIIHIQSLIMAASHLSDTVESMYQPCKEQKIVKLKNISITSADKNCNITTTIFFLVRIDLFTSDISLICYDCKSC